MKLFPVFLLLFIIIIAGCSRKTMPTGKPVTPLLDSAEAAGGRATTTTVTTTAPAVLKPLIIVDARGNFAVTEKDLPQNASASILDNANARAYTPAELQTLSNRFGHIPPRILYVPEGLQKSNSRGTYYVLLKKYYYWKKYNGYFYLDEHYYK